MEMKQDEVVIATGTDSLSTPKRVEPKYTPEEMEYRGALITACNLARDDREAPHAEFDDMTYSQYYDTNKRADMSYIPPKKNKVDKRIVTGYTREKDNTLLSALLSYNFNPDITVYDTEEMIFPVLGNHFEDMVKKSREIEGYDGIRPLIYRELIAQGDVFVEEIWQCIYFPDTENTNNWKPGDKIANAKFDNKVKPRKMERAAVKLHQGKNVYLGSFFQDDYSKQELAYTYELLPRSVAKAIYGKWDRWECVPDEVDNTAIIMDQGQTYFDWNLTKTTKDYVGILKIQQKFKNRYMIMINGVMMLPIDFPLTEISPDGEMTIKHQTLEGIVGCAYGKGQPAKTKVDQAVHDEFLRLLILREEQAGAPPMGYKGKRVLSPNIYNPGKITNNIKEGDLFPILPNNNALGTADFSMYQLIKTMIDDKTMNATFSGDQQDGQRTATQIVQEKQQQLLKLGLNFDAVKNLEKTLVWARIGNLIKNYSKPIGKRANTENPDNKYIEELYRQFSMETTLADGKKGIKVFKFTDKAFPPLREQMKEEDKLTEKYGKPVQTVYFNGPEFMQLLKYRWIVNIVPTQETSDQIEGELFKGHVRDAKELFGPESINYDYAKERFAINIKEDPSRFFLEDGGAGVMNMLASNTPVVGQGNGGAAGAGGFKMSPPKLQPVK
jgi:hypothetical protein